MASARARGQMISLPDSTRFVGKPEGVSNVFLTYFDYFFGGVNTNLGG